MTTPSVADILKNQDKDGVLRALLHLGMEGAQRLPFRRPPYTSLMDDTTVIIGDMVSDAKTKWQAGIMSRFKAGQIPAAGPLAQQTPLVPPERTSGKLLDTAS